MKDFIQTLILAIILLSPIWFEAVWKNFIEPLWIR